MTAAEAQQEEDTSASVRLLGDLREVFDQADAEALYSATILDALHKLEEAPWADWYGHPLRPRELASLLRAYQVRPRDVREHGTGALAAEIHAPEPLGRVLFVNAPLSYPKDTEAERERQAVAVARLVDELRPAHAILAGDLNAEPEAASIRFLRGLQSLDGMSVCYRDAWEAAHPGEPGHTFTPENPTMPTGETGAWALEPGRRIDYVFVRCSDHGPTLDTVSCERLFDEPVDGTWASDHFGVTAELSCLLPDGRPVP
jgi:endonuclease/exonuclease/phosphatase family metal-dependent hydrolase